MKNKILKNIDWSVVICVLLLIAIGCIELFSVTGSSNYNELIKQLVWFAISIPIVCIIVSIDYSTIANASKILYGIMILLLVGVMFTKPINGATSWYNIGAVSFQPSEFAKICVILSLSSAVVRIQRNDRRELLLCR